jgi:hypothetical protein
MLAFMGIMMNFTIPMLESSSDSILLGLLCREIERIMQEGLPRVGGVKPIWLDDFSYYIHQRKLAYDASVGQLQLFPGGFNAL